MMNACPTVDFLIELTGDRYNPTGIITPMTELAFELIHETGLEFVSYGITDSNGYKVERRDLEGFVDYIDQHDTATLAMYHPTNGIAFLEPIA